MKVYLYKAQVKILIQNPQLNLQETLGWTLANALFPIPILDSLIIYHKLTPEQCGSDAVMLKLDSFTSQLHNALYNSFRIYTFYTQLFNNLVKTLPSIPFWCFVDNYSGSNVTIPLCWCTAVSLPLSLTTLEWLQSTAGQQQPRNTNNTTGPHLPATAHLTLSSPAVAATWALLWCNATALSCPGSLVLMW